MPALPADPRPAPPKRDPEDLIDAVPPATALAKRRPPAHPRAAPRARE